MRLDYDQAEIFENKSQRQRMDLNLILQVENLAAFMGLEYILIRSVIFDCNKTVNSTQTTDSLTLMAGPTVKYTIISNFSLYNK